MTGRSADGWGDVGGAVWWRQLRADVWADVVIAVVVALTAFVVAAAPRVLEHASSRDLADTIEGATPEQRNLQFQTRTEIGAGAPTDPFVNVSVRGERLRDEHVPPSVQSLLSGEQWVVDTPEFDVSSFPDDVQGPFPTTFRFRYLDGIEEHSRLVTGSEPTAQPPIRRLEGTQCPVDADVDTFEPVEDQDCELVVLPLFETVVTQQTADDMMVEVGDVVTLRPTPTDVAFRTIQVNPASLRFVLRISGIVELDDERLEYWYADSSLHRPRVTENPDFRLVFAVGLLTPDQYRGFRAAAPGVQLDFAWQYLVDSNSIQRADAGEIRDDVEKISPPGVAVITQLPELLGTHLAQRRLTVVFLSLAAVGVAAGALASVWVLAAVDGARRRPVTELLSDRGASRAQLAVHALRTALIVAGPPALLGAIAAWAAFTDTDGGPTVVPVALVASGGLGAIVVVGTPPAAQADRARRRLRRLVAELLVVAAAIGAVGLLRRRDSSVADALDSGFDATLAIAPALVALAAGLAVLRLVGPIASVLARVAARRRTATWFIGTRRLADQPAALRAPIATIAIAATVAVFAAVVSTSLDRSRELASWQSVGGDERVETGNPDVPLPVRLQEELARRSGPLAFGATRPAQRFEGPSGRFVVDIVALDISSYEAVVADGVLDDTIDASLELLLADSDGAIPALLVGGRSGGAAPSIGDTVELENGAVVVPVELRAGARRFPGVTTGRPTIVVDRGALGATTDARTVEPTFALLGGSAPEDAVARALLDEAVVLARWTSRADRLDEIAGDPLAVWTSRSMWSLGAVALTLAIVTAAAGAVVTAAARRRDLGLLAIQGLERRSTARLVAIEMFPGIVVASLAGALAGAWVAHTLGPNLSLNTFAGGDDAAPIVLAWPVVGAVVGVLAISTALAVAATVRSLRRIDHAMLLRKGDL